MAFHKYVVPDWRYASSPSSSAIPRMESDVPLGRRVNVRGRGATLLGKMTVRDLLPPDGRPVPLALSTIILDCRFPVIPYPVDPILQQKMGPVLKGLEG